MQIVVKEVGLFGPMSVQDMEPGLENMQKIVGGWIECVRVPELQEKGIDLWANEEGKFTQKPSFLLPWGDSVHGVVFFASHNEEGDTTGLTDEQVHTVKEWLAGLAYALPL